MFMTTFNLAFDGANRRIDSDGRLHVAKSHISKAVINPYMGSEIPDYEKLGLDAQKIYQLYRDPTELEKAAPTFARIPILSEHIPVTVDKPRPDLVIGAIGSDVSFNAPYLDADLCIWDAKAIAGIETGAVKELSCAYRYVPVMSQGEINGKHYDGIMTEIRGNHLATVEIGRAGSDVVVADSNPFTFKELTMEMTKLGKALFASLSAFSPKLAKDAALPTMVGSATRKDFDKKSVKAKLIAMDATLSPQQLDNVIDALLDVEQEVKPVEPMAKPATDGSPAEKLRALLEGKVEASIIDEACALFSTPAADSIEDLKKGDESKKDKPAEDEKEDKKEDKKPMDIKAAMDSLRNELNQAEMARRDVRSVVGEMVTMDSAEVVYAFALDQMKVDHKGVTGVPALRALFKVASSKTESKPMTLAQDASGMAERFPSIKRFSKI